MRLALALVAASVASAAADPSTAKLEAKKRVDAATKLHGERRWKEALDELNVAYTLDPQPELLYAIGQLHVALGQCPSAITFYERFIATKPTPAREAVAQKAITVCKTNPPPPEPGPATVRPEPPPEPPKKPVVERRAVRVDHPWYADVVGDVLVGGGIAAGVVAGVFYSSARSKVELEAPTYAEQQRAYDDAKSARTIAIAAGAGAVALVGAGLLRYALHDRRTEVMREVTVGATAEGAAILRGRSRSLRATRPAQRDRRWRGHPPRTLLIASDR